MQNPKSKNSEAVNDGAPRLVSKCEVLALLGGAVGYSTLWGWMREGRFPLAIELGPPGKRSTTIAWYRDEVLDWVAKRPRRQLGRHEFRGRREPKQAARLPLSRRGRDISPRAK